MLRRILRFTKPHTPSLIADDDEKNLECGSPAVFVPELRIRPFFRIQPFRRIFIRCDIELVQMQDSLVLFIFIHQGKSQTDQFVGFPLTAMIVPCVSNRDYNTEPRGVNVPQTRNQLLCNFLIQLFDSVDDDTGIEAPECAELQQGVRILNDLHAARFLQESPLFYVIRNQEFPSTTDYENRVWLCIHKKSVNVEAVVAGGFHDLSTIAATQ